MLATLLINMPSYFKRSINFLPKTKILTSKNLVILNRAFLCSVNEGENTEIVNGNHLGVQAFYQKYLLGNSNYRNLLLPQCIKSVQNIKTVALFNQLDQKGENNPDEKNLKDFSDYLDRELNHFTFSELCELIFLIAKYLKQNSVDTSWDKILQSINEQCFVRVSSLTVDELIIMLNISLELPRYTKFRNKLFYKLMKKCSTSHERYVLLSYLFLCDKGFCKNDDLLKLYCVSAIALHIYKGLYPLYKCAVSLRPIINNLRKFAVWSWKLNEGMSFLGIVALFYFFIRRKISVPKEYLFPLHLKTLKILPEISATEAAVIAEGFYNSFKHLQMHDVYFQVLKKASDDLENIEEVPFQSFCKFSKVMSNIFRRKGIPEFQKNSIKAAQKFGIESVIHLARSGEKAQYLDPDLGDVLMKEVKDRISQLSLFHIERVAYLTTIFNIHDEEFLKLALDAFETEKFTEQTKRSFLLFLKHLVCYKMYPKNLIDFVFGDESFVNPNALRMHLSSAWWFIYCSLEVEQPGYLTLDLAPNYRKRLFQALKSIDNYKYPKHHSSLRYIKSVLAKYFGEGIIKHFMPLPHYPIGLLMRFDKNSKPQMLPEGFLTFNKGHIIKPLKDDHIWMFLTLVSSIHLAGPSTSQLNFLSQTQLRQLNAAGYVVLPVFRKSFGHHSLQDSQAEEYLVNLVNTKLEECCKDQKYTVTN